MAQSLPPRGLPVNPGWYAVAVQALVVLCRACEVCPSNVLAEHVGAHPVFVRRILAQLVRAGLVEAREGRVGGYQLARPPETIVLGDIYRALQLGAPDAKVALEHGPKLEPSVHQALLAIYQQTEQFFVQTLDKQTLADIMQAPIAASAAGEWARCQSALDKSAV